MIKIVPGANNRFNNGLFEVSAPRIIRTLDTCRLPRDLSEKLYHIALDNRQQEWRIQSSWLLVCLAEPSPQYIATLKRYAKELQTFIEGRFESHVSSRLNVSLNRFKDARFFPTTQQEASSVIAKHFDFSLRR